MLLKQFCARTFFTFVTFKKTFLDGSIMTLIALQKSYITWATMGPFSTRVHRCKSSQCLNQSIDDVMKWNIAMKPLWMMSLEISIKHWFEENPLQFITEIHAVDMILKISIPNKGLIFVTVNPGDTLANVKQKIFQQVAIPISHQKLYCTEEEFHSGEYLRRLKNLCCRSKSSPKTSYLKETQSRILSCGRQCINMLHYPRKIMEDSRSLRQYHLIFRHGLSLCYCKTLILHFTTFEKNRIYTIEVESHQTIDAVKSLLEKKFGLQKWQMFLIFHRHVLSNNQTISSYNIPNQSVISIGFSFYVKRRCDRCLRKQKRHLSHGISTLS